jgi:hemolysin III
MTARDVSTRRQVADLHYDAVRDLHYAKPRLRGWSHLIWFVLCLAIGPSTVAIHHGGTRIAGLIIYVVAIAGLFGTSALYHCVTWSVPARRRLQRVDHLMILFMIAGTATPAFLLALPGSPGLAAVIGMWALTIGIAAVHLCRMQVPEKLMGAAFLTLGWAAALAIPAVWIRFGVAAAALLVIGGLLYSAGAISYHRRWPDPIPAIFGYHEVFHAFVCVAATCQFIAIAVLIA